MIRLLLIFTLLATPLWAVRPSEQLSDPVLEARAQQLDHELRCVLCRSESIASSNADWAADARVLVRELLVDGASDEDVLDFFQARYGDYVLMRPRVTLANMALWLAAPILLLIGLLVAYSLTRRREIVAVSPPLTREEQAKVDALIRDNVS